MADPAVKLEGFREFRRTLRKLEPALDKELRGTLKDVAERVAAEARRHAPVRTGTYARSIRPTVTAKGVGIGSRLPQAGVLHWGGTIRPRGVPIVFPRRPVIAEAADRQADRIVDAVGDAVEHAARYAGWQ